MKIYRVEIDGLEDTIVFAATYDHAAEVFITHYMAARDSAPGRFAISRWTASSKEEQRQIDMLLRLGLAGVGYCTAEGIWTISPPDAG
jgi:hypothetical protein